MKDFRRILADLSLRRKTFKCLETAYLLIDTTPLPRILCLPIGGSLVGIIYRQIKQTYVLIE